MGLSAFDAAVRLIEQLDESVRLREVAAVTEHVRTTLEDLIGAAGLRLPERFLTPGSDCYARRLLHRNPELGYTAVVMTWGPGQCTPLHDHSGMWCVEGVVEGAMTVRRFDLREQAKGLFRFDEVESLRAAVGSSGSLIPPHDYHILGNALSDRPSLTLHVYGGERARCHVYHPRNDGWYECSEKQLGYDD